MTDLSPAALKVLDRFCGIVEAHGPARLGLAAVLRALSYEVYFIADKELLLAIADELEGADA